MKDYAGLAAIYDTMMSGVDYESWADYILAAAGHFGDAPATVLDLACGTGSTTLPLAKRGLRATGLDLSEEMLAIAAEKAQKEGIDVDFVAADMLELPFETQFDLVVSFQDGINYLTGQDDLKRLAAAVSGVLRSGGLFLFDLNRVDHYSDSDTTVVDLDELYLVYENHFRRDSGIWEIDITGFVREGEVYRRFDEHHLEKNHELEDVKAALAAENIDVIAVWKMFFAQDATDADRRVLVVAKKREGA